VRFRFKYKYRGIKRVVGGNRGEGGKRRDPTVKIVKNPPVKNPG